MGERHLLEPDIWLTDVALSDFDVRGVLIAGSQRVVVWDTLSHPRDMAAFGPLVEGRMLAIVYSHADWDHVWGTSGLPYEHALIVGHEACLDRFTADVPAALHAKQAAEPGLWDAVKLVAPTATFHTDYSLDLGALTLSLHHAPGHTADSILAFVPERGLLLMGDAAETPLPVVPAGSPLARWIGELERWERNPRVRTVVPSHGAIGGREILQRNIAYLRRLLEGRPFDVPEPLTDFYRATHQANLHAFGAPPPGQFAG
jgi:glyoxylase-like metal-dependent hydrolase (beta-lactamase superfamily II)